MGGDPGGVICVRSVGEETASPLFQVGVMVVLSNADILRASVGTIPYKEVQHKTIYIIKPV